MLSVNGRPLPQFPRQIQVGSLGDFPPVVAGVITLEDNTAYDLSGTVDLLGARLVRVPGPHEVRSYVELWAANTTSGGGSLTVSDMNVSIIRAV